MYYTYYTIWFIIIQFTILCNGWNMFSIEGCTVFSNVPKNLPKNPPDCLISCNWVFNDFILANEPFAKAWQSFETCALVNNNLCGKLFSWLGSTKTFNKNV